MGCYDSRMFELLLLLVQYHAAMLGSALRRLAVASTQQTPKNGRRLTVCPDAICWTDSIAGGLGEFQKHHAACGCEAYNW